MDATITEVVNLAGTDAGAFETVLFDETTGDAQGQLVGIADTILTGKAVLAPQRVVTKGRFTGIEDRQAVLVLIWNVQVHGARLESLAEWCAGKGGVSVEIQAAVDLNQRERTVLIAVKRFISFIQLGLALAIQV